MQEVPSIDEWLNEAKQSEQADQIGMYLVHNGVVRKSPRAQVREGAPAGAEVVGMSFDYDEAKVQAAIEATKRLNGVFYVRVWCNRGQLEVGDTIMQVLIGADIRPHAVDALQSLVGEIKSNCVREDEILR
ncbi:MAG: molybdenum cofactor biosynthesis protein MoaE [Eggerthellaceae bacterium]|jgi:molybdopterin synthase catalytic subunit